MGSSVPLPYSGRAANPVIASEAKQSILPEERNWIASSLRSLQ